MKFILWLMCAVVAVLYVSAQDADRALCWSCASTSMQGDPMVLVNPVVFDDNCFIEPKKWAGNGPQKLCTPANCVEAYLLQDDKKTDYAFRGCSTDLAQIKEQSAWIVTADNPGDTNCTHGTGTVANHKRKYNICHCHNKHLCNSRNITAHLDKMGNVAKISITMLVTLLAVAARVQLLY